MKAACTDASGASLSSTRERVSEFMCRGCYRLCRANPRLKHGEQEYCGSRSCQLLRKERWEQERVEKDPKYRDHRRKAKAASRRKCAARRTARRRVIRVQERPDLAQAGLPEPSASRASLPAMSEPARHKVPIQPGWFLIRPADAPECATQTVEIAVVWSCPSPTIEQVSSASETDAFLLVRCASGAAKKGAS